MRSSDSNVAVQRLLWLCFGLAMAAPSAATGAAPGAAGGSIPVAVAPGIFTKVEFDGARSLPPAELRRALALPLPSDSLYAALRRLGGLYYEFGFVGATFLAEPLPDGRLVVHVHEGRAARLAQVHVRGAQVLGGAEVQAALGLRPGQPFRALAVEAGLQALLEEYARRGYLDAEAVLERLEFGPEGVVLGVAISEGGPVTLTEVSVQGNSTSQTRLVQRLARLPTPQLADARRIHEAPQLLRRSGLFSRVEEPVFYRQGSPGQVGVLLRVAEAQRRNTIFGLVGMGRDPRRDRPFVTGAVDLALRNIYGTGRDLAVSWKRDALAGSQLAFAYHERFLLGQPFDLSADAAQTERDSTYTWQSFGGAVTLPVNRNLSVEVGSALDRSVYFDRSPSHAGTQGNTLRFRYRVGLRFESLQRDEDGHPFGSFEVRAEYGRKKNDLVQGGVADRTRVRQTLWSGRVEAGVPLRPRHVLAARGQWQALDSNEFPVPASELYYFGGARSLRGYREDQFRGDQVMFGSLEYRYGEARGSRLYAFMDVGALRRRVPGGGHDQSAHVGYGLGLRTAVASGVFDLSFGMGEEHSLSAAKVHVSLVQGF